MNTETFTYLLAHPEHVTASQTAAMRDILQEFPFFQSAHALYLKGLKNQESFAYNNALKVTAAHTADRSVLFDYITSKEFNQNDISDQIKLQEQRLRGIQLKEEQDVSLLLETEELAKADKILDPTLFVEKEDSEMTRETPEQKLNIGKPLTFAKSETHSFSEWLQFATFTPVDRSVPATEPAPFVALEKSKSQERTQGEIHTPQGISDLNVSEEKEEISKKRKQRLVDAFIETNPKINVTADVKVEKKNLAKASIMSQEALMTETLARVYVEQKNFKKAKQAYRILSLKYPEKSGFFADQIRAVEQLEEK